MNIFKALSILCKFNLFFILTCYISGISVAQTHFPAFNSNIEKLPNNYQGVDSSFFYNTFKSKLSNLVKGEFETTAEFEARKSKVELIIKPIDPKALYAFRLNNFRFTYEPDSEVYRQDKYMPYSCNQGLGESKEYVFCPIKDLWRKSDSYIGRNSFGASRNVERYRGKSISLAIKKETPFLADNFSKPQYYFQKYAYLNTIPTPIDEAKKLKKFTISTILIGHVNEASLHKTAEIKEPKMDSPSDIFIEIDGIPFEPKRIIHYVLENGQILYDSDKISKTDYLNQNRDKASKTDRGMDTLFDAKK